MEPAGFWLRMLAGLAAGAALSLAAAGGFAAWWLLNLVRYG